MPPKPPSPPWVDWKLDEEFLGALDRWTAAHPGSTIDNILDQICTAIDDSKDIVDLIPDSPLVKALGQLIKLGTVRLLIMFQHGMSSILSFLQAVAKAKTEVRDFAKEIVQFISQVMTAFRNGEAGHFTLATWRNLEELRCVHSLLYFDGSGPELLHYTGL